MNDKDGKNAWITVYEKQMREQRGDIWDQIEQYDKKLI